MHVVSSGAHLPAGTLSVMSGYRGWGSAAHVEMSGLSVAPASASAITVFGKNGVLRDTATVQVSQSTALSGATAELAADVLQGYGALADRLGERRVWNAAAAVDPHANSGVALVRTDEEGRNFVLKTPGNADLRDDAVRDLFSLTRKLTEATGITIENLSSGC